VLAVAFAALAWSTARPAPPDPLVLRLLGPLAELASEVQWLRFRAAVRAGEEARGLRLAESALTWNPRANAGWETVASHLVFDLASTAREPELARRRAWFEAGLALLARGRERVERPAALELARGLFLLGKAELDPELAPGGAAELQRRAYEAFEAAAALGEARAAALLPQLRAEVERP
jgi:hypothetical protein